jgi:hypothetical protein
MNWVLVILVYFFISAIVEDSKMINCNIPWRACDAYDSGVVRDIKSGKLNLTNFTNMVIYWRRAYILAFLSVLTTQMAIYENYTIDSKTLVSIIIVTFFMYFSYHYYDFHFYKPIYATFNQIQSSQT